MITEKVVFEYGLFELSFNHGNDEIDPVFLVAVSRETKRIGANLYIFKEIQEQNYRQDSHHFQMQQRRQEQ